MRYYKLEPEVPGQLDRNTIMEPPSENHYLPHVERLHVRIEGWLGDDLLEIFPCYFITGALKETLEVSALSGFEIADMEVLLDAQLQMFPQMAASWPLPQFHWLKITGSATHEDFGLTPSNAPISLVVSEGALNLLNSFAIGDCGILEYQ